MRLYSPVDIRDADQPAQSFPLLGNRREYGDLKSVAPECLPKVQERRALRLNVGGLGCNA